MNNEAVGEVHQELEDTNSNSVDEEKNRADSQGQPIKDNSLSADRAVFCVWCGQTLYTYNGPPPAENEAAACVGAARDHEPQCEESPVRKWIAAAVKAERERCAKIAETQFANKWETGYRNGGIMIASAIRATTQDAESALRGHNPRRYGRE